VGKVDPACRAVSSECFSGIVNPESWARPLLGYVEGRLGLVRWRQGRSLPYDRAVGAGRNRLLERLCPYGHAVEADARFCALDLVASVPEFDPALQARAGVLTGEAAVTIGAQAKACSVLSGRPSSEPVPVDSWARAWTARRG
jgi:hypothetical protein